MDWLASIIVIVIILIFYKIVSTKNDSKGVGGTRPPAGREIGKKKRKKR